MSPEFSPASATVGPDSVSISGNPEMAKGTGSRTNAADKHLINTIATGNNFQRRLYIIRNFREVLLIFLGNQHSFQPAAQAPPTAFPSDRQLADTRPRKRDLAGHRHVASHFNATVIAEMMEVTIPTPADGPSFGVAPSGTCTCTSCLASSSKSIP